MITITNCRVSLLPGGGLGPEVAGAAVALRPIAAALRGELIRGHGWAAIAEVSA